MSVVSVVGCEGYDNLMPHLVRLFGQAGSLGLKTGDTVAIKINLCDARTPETGAITHPWFLDALLRFVRETYEDIDLYVVESDSTVVLADDFIRWFGFLPVIEKWDAKWRNLSKDEIVLKPIDGHFLKSVPVPALLLRANLISLSKLKTNSLTRITTSLKNQFGCLPMVGKSVYHDHLAEVVADVNLAMRPIFSIVDGILAMGGASGPSFGVPIRANVILAGRDPVAVACASAEFMGISPGRVRHIQLATSLGVGSMHYELVGDNVDRIDFELDRLADLQSTAARLVKKVMRHNSRLAWKQAK